MNINWKRVTLEILCFAIIAIGISTANIILNIKPIELGLTRYLFGYIIIYLCASIFNKIDFKIDKL